MDGIQLTLEVTIKKKAGHGAVAFGGFSAAVYALYQVAPNTAAKVSAATLGVELAAGKGITGVSPLVLTWLLPQPIGLIPPEAGGIRPSYYLPPALGAQLPSIVPGSDDLRQQAAIDKSARLEARARAETTRIQQLFPNLGSESLATIRANASNPANNVVFADPVNVVALIDAELARREAQRIASNARLGFDASGNAIQPDPNQVAKPVGLSTLYAQLIARQTNPADIGALTAALTADP